jgi:hypothetical protein
MWSVTGCTLPEGQTTKTKTGLKKKFDFLTKTNIRQYVWTTGEGEGKGQGQMGSKINKEQSTNEKKKKDP